EVLIQAVLAEFDADALTGDRAHRRCSTLVTWARGLSDCPESETSERAAGMATIRDKMGHCLHESFTMRRSREQAAALAAWDAGRAYSRGPGSFGPGSACTCRTG